MQPMRGRSSRRTIFSPSPIHLEVSEDAEMAKNVARMLAATALPSSVFPVPARHTKVHLRMVTSSRHQAQVSCLEIAC